MNNYQIESRVFKHTPLYLCHKERGVNLMVSLAHVSTPLSMASSANTAILNGVEV